MKLRIVLSLVFLASASSLLAQTPTDTELWTGGTIKVRLSKTIRIDLEEQFRFNDAISAKKATFTELGFRYRTNKHLAFKLSYRYIFRPDKANRNRFSFDAYYNWDKKNHPLAFQYRLRLQDAKENNSVGRTNFVRNKITFDYNLTRLVDPFISQEIYFRFNQKNEFRTWRFTGGLDWRISKQIDLKTFYRYQKELNVRQPEAQHIFGLMLTYGTRIQKK